MIKEEMESNLKRQNLKSSVMAVDDHNTNTCSLKQIPNKFAHFTVNMQAREYDKP